MIKISARSYSVRTYKKIQYVKKHLLHFAQGVIEARFYVEETLKNHQTANNIGNSLDPELELQILDCQDQEEILTSS